MRLIDADRLKAELDAWARIIRKPNCYSREDALHIIDTAPEVNAVPVVRGEWKTWEEQFPDRTTRKKNNLGVFCSACQLHADNMTSYCPNCGAKMEDKPCG